MAQIIREPGTIKGALFGMEKSTSVPTLPVNDDDSSAATKRPRLADSVSPSQEKRYEHKWIKIKLRGNDSLHLAGCIYRSPTSNLQQSTAALCDLFRSVTGFTHLLITGDFNYPDINWSHCSCTNHNLQLFLDTIQDMYLFQHVMCPTRYRSGSVPNILDLIFTNEEENVSNIDYLPGLGLSDHLCLQFNLICYCTVKHQPKPKYNLYSADFSTMRELLEQIDWESIIYPLDIHTAWQTFSSLFTATLNSCIPFSIPRPKKNIFMTRRGLCLKNKKCKLWHKFRSTNSPSDYKSYCQARNELRKLTRSLRESYEQSLASNRKIDVKHFWKYVNSRLKIHPTINSLYRDDIILSLIPPSAKLADYFSSKLSHSSLLDTPPVLEDCHYSLFRQFRIKKSQVRSVLLSLDVNKSIGDDGLSPQILKSCAQLLSGPLTSLFRKICRQSILPASWKISRITPVFKKGSRSDPTCYRPIAVLPTLSRVFERLLAPQLRRHIDPHIPREQFGFMRGSSTSDAGVSLASTITAAIDQRAEA